MDAGQVAVGPVGVRRRGSARLAGRGGSTTTTATSAAASAQATHRHPHRGVRPGPVGHHRHRRGGDTDARRLRHLPDPHRQAPAAGGNQPTTTRPLATLLLAAASPARPRPSASGTTDAGQRGQVPKSAAPTSPTSSTSRSPRRSVTTPHGTRASITPGHRRRGHQPGLGQAQPLRVVQAGMRNAGPCTITAVDGLGHGARREHRPAPAYADLDGAEMAAVTRRSTRRLNVGRAAAGARGADLSTDRSSATGLGFETQGRRRLVPARSGRRWMGPCPPSRRPTVRCPRR